MPLPNFLIIGATKSGTTSLYYYLKEHPEIFMPDDLKEARFFCYEGTPRTLKVSIRTLEQYKALFAGVTTEKAIGEASPHYLDFPDAAGRIKELIPDVRLIGSIRNPVDRAYSMYLMNLRSSGRNRGLTFLQALERDPWLQANYFEKFNRFLSLFPEEQLKVILFDDISSAPRATVTSLFHFLGVDSKFCGSDVEIHNQGGLPKSILIDRLAMDPFTRRFVNVALPRNFRGALKRVVARNLAPQKLTLFERESALEVFTYDILRTQELLQLNLSKWLSGSNATEISEEASPGL
ncbi:MAG: sulfotransferase [Thiocapsa sp.]|uniref:sulfotransferase family protein n=1 Tax=Thiocapsa sp. TaxID=2024551 RepID=UPI001BCC1663|nr:sulfotransferase [Thiocapsa sp.]QVL50297.1 MAG: sulfotransferase [Thiocapsa sp.]